MLLHRLLPCLLLAACFAPALAADAQVYRLSDLVGDTIGPAARDSFRLFPGIEGFRYAVILAAPDSAFSAELGEQQGDSLRRRGLPLTATQVARMRFLINNRDFVRAEAAADSYSARALADFWHGVEGRSAAEAGPAPDYDNRRNCMMHGLTAGSAAGGCAASWLAISEVVPAHYEDCFGMQTWVPGTYQVNHPVFWTTACGITALGAFAGYKAGERLDRQAILEPRPVLKEGVGARAGCTFGAVLPGVALGLLTFFLAGPTHFGKTDFLGDIQNDPDGATLLPAVLMSACVTVEVISIGYQVGRSIDRRNAERAAEQSKSRRF